MKKILLSFVGANDGGKLLNQQDGGILTALKNEKFDEIVLICNQSKIRDIYYSDIVDYLSKDIKRNTRK